MEMKKYKLGDILELQRGYDLTSAETKNADIPVAGSNGVIGYHDVAKCITPCITVGRSGSVGKVHFYRDPVWVHNTALYVSNFKGNDPQYLYYLLSVLKLDVLCGSSVVPSLNRNVVYPMEVPFCSDIGLQKKISSILSTLDKRIENLRAQNRILEQTAKTIYDYTFLQCAGHQTVYNKTLNRNIPVNWEVKKLGDLLTIKNGKDHKHLKDGPFAVYGSGGLMRKVDSFLYDGESVLIPRKGTLNNVMYVDEKFWTVDTMFYSVMNKPYYGKYIYYSVRDIDFMARNSGTGVPSMTSGYLNTISIALPDSQTLETFNNQVTPLFKKVQLNTKQIETLTTQRNTLLPLLMTGQIEVV